MSPTVRRVGAAVILLVGIIHFALAPEGEEYALGIQILFVLGGLGCVVVAVGLLRGSDPRAWALGSLICIGMVVAFVLSRTVGLPGVHEKEWEPLGILSLVLEVAFVVLAARVARPAAAPPARA